MKHFDYPDYLKNLLFVSIGTATASPSYESLDGQMRAFWDKKAEKWDASQSPEMLYPNASLVPEFGKVIAIGLGYFRKDRHNRLTFRATTLKQDTEKELLLNFKDVVERRFKSEVLKLVSHNGKSFTYPYLARRMIVQSIRLPKILQLHGKSPWQIPHLDTLEIWRMGDIRSFVSLSLLTKILGLPNQSQKPAEHEVNQNYHQEKDLEKIGHQCAEDVASTAAIYLRMMHIPDLKEEDIHFV